MCKFNLYTLLHRNYILPVDLPNGDVVDYPMQREMPIRIPRIQRDYAEGRKVESVERKRRNLLNDMLDVVFATKKDLSFDFIYGYIKNQKGEMVTEDSWKKDAKQKYFFDPLDGQQRLTTLFLLHWLFGRNDTIRNKAKESLFIYQTRDTSEEFCHWLVKQDAPLVIGGWKTVLKKAKKINEENQERWKSELNAYGVVDQIANRLRYPLVPEPSLWDYMQSLDTFKWDWHDDPNIRSMINVLQSAIDLIDERGLSYEKGILGNANLNNIDFMLLDNLACDGDQLFEKMNARGKPLTSFEVLKSSLEEEMERQDLQNRDPVLTNDWRKSIDIDWMDFCWDNRDNLGVDAGLPIVQKVEGTLETLIIRMVEKSFYLTDIRSTPSGSPDSADYGHLLGLAAQGKENSKVMDRYFDYARYERAVKNVGFSKLDFQTIFDDIRNLIFKDQNGIWRDASTLIPKLNRDNDNTLLYEFLFEPSHSIRVMMYAMLAYLRIVSAREIAGNAIEEDNFRDWMRFIRNVYKADNKTARLDNFDDVTSAIKAVDKWLGVFSEKYSERKAQDVMRLICRDIPLLPESQEEGRLYEESIKAGLRLNGTLGVAASDWEKSILKAEDNFYLWGQIVAPLSWSRYGESYDKDEFDAYTELLGRWFQRRLDGQPLDALLIQTMLCYDDYRHNKKYDQNKEGELGSLGLLNDHRDHSWKRYLRDKDTNTDIYAPLFKRILDEWRKYPSLTIDALLRQEIADKKDKFSISEWQYYIVNISDPKVLLNLFGFTTSGRYVYVIPSGHAYLFKSNTFRTANRFELLTCYLAYETQLLADDVEVGYPAHTSDKDGAHIDFILKNDANENKCNIIRLSVKDQDLYDILRQDAGPSTWQILHHGIPVKAVETELKTLNVIKHL